ncbi:motile sperm domain-containing protein 1-like isoform X2 [Osmerus eperlanus]|uniref:motile sperm domain-containing protein 1-like isoform X2 n=1 Tax=Osmerus eperlanus TaxID=29151 RepID=UPI002E119AEE
MQQPISRQDGGRGRRRGKGGERKPASPPASPTPLPVFLFPHQLVFYSDQRSTHRRVLTLYNPYAFPLAFKMMCTAPSLYSVVEAEGSVRAKSCVDLVVRHQEVRCVNQGRRDRFRLQVRGGGRTGSREVWAELRRGEEGEDSLQRRTLPPPSPRLHPPLPPPPTCLPGYPTVRSRQQGLVLGVLGVVCVALLLLPLQPQHSSLVPPCTVSLTQKLVCAYILGQCLCDVCVCLFVWCGVCVSVTPCTYSVPGLLTMVFLR